jgi:hypothetical protein
MDISSGHPHIAAFVGALARKLSDHMHIAADDRARALGWAITETSGWLGLRGRRYRDPRFAAQRQAHRTTQATRSARHG